LQLAPLLRGILSHPLIFNSLDEPTMIKPPIVYTVGILRALAVPIRGQHVQPMFDMGMSTHTQATATMPFTRRMSPDGLAGWRG
jgi:hypothetical protein